MRPIASKASLSRGGFDRALNTGPAWVDHFGTPGLAEHGNAFDWGEGQAALALVGQIPNDHPPLLITDL